MAARAVELAMETIDGVGGRRNAAPLLLAHGLLGQGANLRAVARHASRTRSASVVDMRNHGRSPWTDEMTYLAMAADLAAAAARLGDGPLRLLGHSMGGKAAMATALTSPQLVESLIVVDIAPTPYEDAENRAIVAALRAADLSAARSRADVAPQIAHVATDAAMSAFLLQNLALETGEDGVRHARWRPNLDAIAAALPDIVGWPKELAGRRYEGPALFVVGGRSSYVTDVGRAAIAARFPRAELRVIPEAGHWVHAEAPQEFAAALEEWL